MSATTKTLTIEWTHPGVGGSPLDRNYVHYRVQGTTEWSNWYAGETPVTRAAIGRLQPNTAYEVRVSVTNAIGSSGWVMGATAFSTRANTPATGAPTITGTAAVGQMLTASTTGIADADGLPANFSYQWVRVDADGTSNPVDIPGAITATYTLTADDLGKRLKVTVSFTDNLETTKTLTSEATATVAARSHSLVFSETSLDVPEAGSASYSVKLGTLPTAEVTVSIGGTSGTDLSLNIPAVKPARTHARDARANYRRPTRADRTRQERAGHRATPDPQTRTTGHRREHAARAHDPEARHRPRRSRTERTRAVISSSVGAA